MASSINLSLTDELRAFVDSQCGDGSDYSTPSEFVRELLREKKRRIEAAELRDGVIEGYRDLIEGRFVQFDGSIDEAIAEGKRRDREGW
jgi:antitoxin ParD1/3/4